MKLFKVLVIVALFGIACTKNGFSHPYSWRDHMNNNLLLNLQADIKLTLLDMMIHTNYKYRNDIYIMNIFLIPALVFPLRCS